MTGRQIASIMCSVAGMGASLGDHHVAAPIWFVCAVLWSIADTLADRGRRGT